MFRRKRFRVVSGHSRRRSSSQRRQRERVFLASATSAWVRLNPRWSMALVEAAARSWICWRAMAGVVEAARRISRVPFFSAAAHGVPSSCPNRRTLTVHAKEGDEGRSAPAEGSAMEHRAQAGSGERADAFDLQDAAGTVQSIRSRLISEAMRLFENRLIQGGEPRARATRTSRPKPGQDLPWL
ncbi:hypothetical protein [Methyloversatilis thermotolerans]|uniref:hypothetical protein n=1 Tax=Methyloversatilis thermotolerans TaxID=1346290 RepID=UPI001E5714CB|nr:hypothetical protein [Methyloversatilis thermotolerans]